MKRILSISALSMAVIGTTLWAQQSDDASPARSESPAANADRVSTDPPRASVDTTKPNSQAPRRPGPAHGQQPARADNAPRVYAPGPAAAGGIGNPYPTSYMNGLPYAAIYGAAGYGAPGPNENPQAAREFRETVDSFRRADSEEQRTELRAKINDMVSKQLDQDLAEREKKLEELEARTKQLRDQLQQRKQLKAEIVKLIVMTIENPQGGLGLPSSWLQAINQSGYGGGSESMMPPSLPYAVPVNSYNQAR